MTNREKYKKAFSALHAPEEISLEPVYREKKFMPSQKLISICICAALICALTVTAYAYRSEVISQIFGWGGNFEITNAIDENGEETATAVLYTEQLTDPVIISDGRMIFIVNDETIDITDQVSETNAFRYEYVDGDGYVHVWIVGLISSDIDNFGYAEYIKDSSGVWIGGYSARVDIHTDGSTSAQWLESSKSELCIPW